MTHKSKKILASCIGGLLLMSGCASFQDYKYEWTQQWRARNEYRHAGHPDCSKYPKDYKKGWIDGFYEVSTGGSCCPPAIAPSCYWKPGQILDDCDNRRFAYYSGWQDGAARASQFPDTHYLKIWETDDCPFPRCECTLCGQTPCGCAPAACQSCQTGAPMAYHPGAIEVDREIIMLPIPSEDELGPDGVESAPAKADQAAAAEANESADLTKQAPPAVSTPPTKKPTQPTQSQKPDAGERQPAADPVQDAPEDTADETSQRVPSLVDRKTHIAERIIVVEEQSPSDSFGVTSQSVFSPNPSAWQTALQSNDEGFGPTESDAPSPARSEIETDVQAIANTAKPKRPQQSDVADEVLPVLPAVSDSTGFDAVATGDVPTTDRSVPTAEPAVVLYRYGDDNSVTIEFDSSDPSVGALITSESQSSSVLSDFDIQIDGDGLIE